jgi:hypothetical protein
LTRIKVRRLGLFRGAKYIEAFADSPSVYPSMATIRPPAPLVIVEGEFDALLLGQELADLASVVTLGSSSSRPEGSLYLAMLRCSTWFIALDADEAGERAAAEWPARAVRIRPPAGKDWVTAGRPVSTCVAGGSTTSLSMHSTARSEPLSSSSTPA